MTPYLIVSIVLFLVWLLIFFLSSETRREQVLMSVIGLVLTPGAVSLALDDYRIATANAFSSLGIEDFLFAFSCFGIAAVIYQALFGKHISRLKGKKFQTKNPALHWAALLVILFGAWIFIALSVIAIFSVSAVMAFCVGAIMIGIYIVADRHDLLANALLSGLLIAILLFIIEQLFLIRMFPGAEIGLWHSQGVEGMLVGGIPVQEIIWSAVAGFAIGPMYEYVKGWKLI